MKKHLWFILTILFFSCTKEENTFQKYLSKESGDVINPFSTSQIIEGKIFKISFFSTQNEDSTLTHSGFMFTDKSDKNGFFYLDNEGGVLLVEYKNGNLTNNGSRFEIENDSLIGFVINYDFDKHSYYEMERFSIARIEPLSKRITIGSAIANRFQNAFSEFTNSDIFYNLSLNRNNLKSLANYPIDFLLFDIPSAFNEIENLKSTYLERPDFVNSKVMIGAEKLKFTSIFSLKEENLKKTDCFGKLGGTSLMDKCNRCLTKLEYASLACNLPKNTVIDIDGNVYYSTLIGNQTWMVTNLKTKKYNDGTSIRFITNSDEWQRNTSAAMTEDEAWGNTIYGRLYNWYAVNTGKLCPTGWRVPTQEDIQILIDNMGGQDVAGGKLKSKIFWRDPNTGADNSSVFYALPGGYRHATGYLATSRENDKGLRGYWWLHSEETASFDIAPLSLHLAWNSSSTEIRNNTLKRNAYSCRCIKD